MPMKRKRYSVCIDDGGAWVREECHEASSVREAMCLVKKLRAKRPGWPRVGIYDETKNLTVAFWERTSKGWKRTPKDQLHMLWNG